MKTYLATHPIFQQSQTLQFPKPYKSFYIYSRGFFPISYLKLDAYQEYKNFNKCSFTLSSFNFHKYRIFCGIFEVSFEKLEPIYYKNILFTLISAKKTSKFPLFLMIWWRRPVFPYKPPLKLIIMS